MARIRLTDRTLRRPPPAAGQTELWDDLVPGFGLRIAAGGSRTFFVMKRLNGKLVRRTVGKVAPQDGPQRDGELSLPAARDRARKLLSDLARGVDPDQRKASVTDRAASMPSTFGDVAGKVGPDDKDGKPTWVTGAYFKDRSRRGGGALKSRAELERKVRVDLKGWANRKLDTITKADVRAVIEAKQETSPIAANRLLALIRRVLRWAVREKLIDANPAMDIDGSAEVERERVLKTQELARIWAGAEAMGYPYGPLVQLLILTAQRRNEVAEAPWSEIDGNAWRLADDRAKRGKGHLIPLSPRAVSIIESLPKMGDPPKLLFTTGKRAAKKGEKIDPKAPPAPVSGWSRMKTRLDRIIAEQAAKAADEPLDLEKHSLAPWTLHDIRRSVATHLRDGDVMGEDRVERLTVSKILNHAEGGMTRLYDRYSADPEQRRALEAWALRVERLCGLNVLTADFGRATA
ncbi:MAG: integrase arm-type DNA-binding domain-containing protein [Phenylobacterium sp.]|uniref:tyrosine-type recombinase/integrase n=1 Tax=Phenylobacterium sp. TaxID=1871053 RepID=UPI001A28A9B5|nr:integrase arm-type DNA-binding domain-containing protein [Phenylobacterium sp.]MBJ7410854.1 integrase arm-type DNA-binding domain-containing protein [Phenylobacterium sp.]